MTRKPKLNRIAILMIVYGLLLAAPAYGYIDPNATNLLTQILTPLLVVAATALTFLRKQAGSAFGRLSGWIRRKK